MRRIACLLFLQMCIGCATSPAWQLNRLGGSIQRDSGGIVVGVDLSRGIYMPVAGDAGNWTVVGDPLLRQGRVDDSHLTVLRDFADVESLRLTGTDVTGSALTGLQKPNTLRLLDLSATQVSDEDLPVLAAFINLTELHLSGTSISDNGLRKLAVLARLEIVAIDNTAITDEGFAMLLQMNSLRTIYVRDTRISPSAIKKAKKAKPQLNIVSERPVGGVI